MDKLAAHLAPEDIAHYREQGFLVLKGLFSQAQLKQWNDRFLEVVDSDPTVLPDAMKVMRDVMVVKGAVKPASPVHAVNKLLCLENDPVLSSFSRAPELVGPVKDLLGEEEIYSLSSNVFNKPPGVDGRHPLHQDLRYFKVRPADKIIGVWCALLHAGREQGCLAVIPGSHHMDLLPHNEPDWDYLNHGFFGVEDIDLSLRQHVEMAPGDTLLFHPLLIHGSGRNRSSQFRRAISVHYAAGSATSPKGEWQTRGLTRRVS